MTYTWRCTSCGETVDVRRRMVDCMIPPMPHESHHEGCFGQGFTRVITNGMKVHVHENEDQYWNDDNYK